MQIVQIFLVQLFSGGSPSEGSKVGFDCKTDWISIPCATNTLSTSQNGTPNICVDRICGMVFNSVTQTPTLASSPPAEQVPVNSKYHSCSSNLYNPTSSTRVDKDLTK